MSIARMPLKHMIRFYQDQGFTLHEAVMLAAEEDAPYANLFS